MAKSRNTSLQLSYHIGYQIFTLVVHVAGKCTIKSHRHIMYAHRHNTSYHWIVTKRSIFQISKFLFSTRKYAFGSKNVHVEHSILFICLFEEYETLPKRFIKIWRTWNLRRWCVGRGICTHVCQTYSIVQHNTYWMKEIVQTIPFWSRCYHFVDKNFP